MAEENVSSFGPASYLFAARNLNTRARQLLFARVFVPASAARVEPPPLPASPRLKNCFATPESALID